MVASCFDITYMITFFRHYSSFFWHFIDIISHSIWRAARIRRAERAGELAIGGCVEEAGKEAGDDLLARKLASTEGKEEGRRRTRRRRRKDFAGCPAKI